MPRESYVREPRLQDIARRMRQEWDARALHDAPYFVRQSTLGQDEDAFDRSGALNVRTFVEPDLPLICRGREPRSLRVLEIGCGIGRLTRHLGRLFGEVHGVDVSDEMVRRGASRLRDLTHVRLHTGNGIDLSSFESNFFDFVFSYIVFQHIPDRTIIENYLLEAARVLRTEGLFKFQVHGGDKDYQEDAASTWSGAVVTEEDVRLWAGRAGLEVVSLTGFGSQYAWATLRAAPGAGTSVAPPSFSGDAAARRATHQRVRVVIPIFERNPSQAVVESIPEPDVRFTWVDCRPSPDVSFDAGPQSSIIRGDPSWSFEEALSFGSRDVSEPYWAALCEHAFPSRGWLTALVSAAERHPELDAIGAPLLRVRSSGHVDRLTTEPRARARFILWEGGPGLPETIPLGAVLFRNQRASASPTLAIEEGAWVSAFDLEPEFYRGWLVDLGQAYEKNGLRDEAEARFRACLELFPDDPQARAGLRRLGEPGEPSTRHGESDGSARHRPNASIVTSDSSHKRMVRE